MEPTPEWVDLEVEVGQAAGGGLEVRILRSPINRPREVFTPPFPGGGARRKWQDLDGWIQQYLRSGGDAGKCPPLDWVALGKQLYDALFPSALHRTLAWTSGWADKGAGLRIRLSFDTSAGALNDGAVLPWELTWSPHREEFLGLDPQTPMVRYIDSLKPQRAIEVGPPLRVLLVAANPDEDLDLEGEQRAIVESVGDSGLLEIELLAEPTLESLKECLYDGQFQVLHFMGHGGFDEDGGFLVFESADGEERGVTDRVLANALSSVQSLRLVVLAACEGAQLSCPEGSGGLHGVAARLMRQGPAVVGMQFVVSDRAAARFSGAFYRSLVRGQLLEQAVTEGRRAIFHDDEQTLEWASPVLFLGVPEGRLVKTPPAKPPEAPREPEGERILGIFSVGTNRWGKDALERVEYPLDLTTYFKPEHDGRYIRDEALWPVVGAEVARFLPGVVSRTQPNVLEMATHISVAYAAGRSLEAMAGYEVICRHQRGMRGAEMWRVNEGEVPGGWTLLDERELEGGGRETALAITVSQTVTDDVLDYLRGSELPIGRLLVAGVEEGQLSVKSGAHAFKLAEKLFQWVRDLRRKSSAGPLHVFLSGPVGFAFFLGRLTRDWGEVQLYEHDRDDQMPTKYRPSLRVGRE